MHDTEVAAPVQAASHFAHEEELANLHLRDHFFLVDATRLEALIDRFLARLLERWAAALDAASRGR